MNGGGAPERLECIDGLRGWASVMVVLSHLWGQFAKHVVPAYDHPFLRMISDGHLAVLIFFVLSGVALSLRYVRKPKRVALFRLVAARYVRLVVPILSTTLIVYLLISLHVAGHREAAQLAASEIFLGARHNMPSSLTDALMFSFYAVLFDYHAQTTFNWSLWTMPVEFSGSLLVFGLLFLFSKLPRLARRYRVVIICGLTAALLLLSKQLAACFTAGYVLAELVCTYPAAGKWLRLASLAFAAAGLTLSAVVGRQDDHSGALLAIGIVMAGHFWPVANSFLSSQLSRWLGHISFPLYLIHVPVIGCAGMVFLAMRHNDVPAHIATHLTMVLAFAGSLVAAWLLLPVERLSIRLSRAAGSFRWPSRRADSKPSAKAQKSA